MMLLALWSGFPFAFLMGALVGAACWALGSWLYRRQKNKSSITDLLRRHFSSTAEGDLEVYAREFPFRVSVDAYMTVQEWIEEHCRVSEIVGVPVGNTFMESASISSLLSPNDQPLQPSAIEYDAVDVGTEQPIKCVKHALWLLHKGSEKMAFLWTSTTSHNSCGFETMLRLDLAVSRSKDGTDIQDSFYRNVEKGIQSAKAYRGKVLSLEANNDFRGTSGGILVHRLHQVARDEVILPQETVRLLERNVIRFVQQRPQLASHGMPQKKGLLFYGPPGTGKTHTLHYLFGSLPGHTVLLITGDQIGLLKEYISLARLLQPSIVVIEDADLIGGEREGVAVQRESLLNGLLNEMDGLRGDAEILFLLTTNRPEALEKALAARPGRVDQAIEFPLPDFEGREKLIRLYAAGATLSDEVVAHTAKITQGVSAAFIKELLRRALQFHLECGTTDGELFILQNDIDQAIEELLHSGGSLNRTLLGADDADYDDQQ